MLRDVTILIPVDYKWKERVVLPLKRKHDEVDETAEAVALRHLLECTRLKNLCIQIQGKGPTAGTGFGTQQKIKELCRVFRDIISMHGDRLTLEKACNIQAPQLHPDPIDLKPYWNAPSAEAIYRMAHGKPTIRDMMQVQIAEWTKEESENSHSSDDDSDEMDSDADEDGEEEGGERNGNKECWNVLLVYIEVRFG